MRPSGFSAWPYRTFRPHVADDQFIGQVAGARGRQAAQTGGGILKGVGGATGEKANSAINAIGGLFGGSKSTTTNAAPATTNSSPVGGLLKMFK